MNIPKTKECPVCNGERTTRLTGIGGYVTHDMAMDAGDLSLEGEPIYVDERCWKCGGDGWVYDDEDS